MGFKCTEKGIKFVFGRAVEGISDYIHKNTDYKAKNNPYDPILYGDYANNSTDDDDDYDPPYFDQQIDTPADSDTLFTNQRRFTCHPHTLSRNRHQYTTYTNYTNKNYRLTNAGNDSRQYGPYCMGPGQTRLAVRTLHRGSSA